MSHFRFCSAVTLAATFSAAALVTGSADAALITNSATAPTVDGDDVANLGAPTGGQSIWSDRPVQGQTFTSPATGGELVSVTIQLNEGANAPIDGWKDYQLRVGTVDTGAGTITPLLVTVDRYTPDANNDSYFTFTFDSPITLAPSVLYGFDVGVEASSTGWQSGIPQIRTTGDDFAGGQRFSGSKTNQIDNTTGLPNTISLGNDDLAFHADIVPEPGSLALIALGGLFAMRRRKD
jgi:hypothetical protein